MIERVGKILNEDGEWVEYTEMDDPDRPPIKFDYMGTASLPISPDDEVVDFCMQYRIPKVEGLTECKNLKVSISIFCNKSRVFIFIMNHLEIGSQEKFG